MDFISQRIEATGDHPMAGAFCPGRHREPWTVQTVLLDAAEVNLTRRRAGGHEKNNSRPPAAIARLERNIALNLLTNLAREGYPAHPCGRGKGFLTSAS
jgi:hypothetical protein